MGNKTSVQVPRKIKQRELKSNGQWADFANSYMPCLLKFVDWNSFACKLRLVCRSWNQTGMRIGCHHCDLSEIHFHNVPLSKAGNLLFPWVFWERRHHQIRSVTWKIRDLQHLKLPASACISVKQTFRYLQSEVPCLTELNLSNSAAFNENAFDLLIGITGLKKVALTNCRLLTAPCLNFLAANKHTLTHLDLSGDAAVPITFGRNIQLISMLTNLRVLGLAKCTEITDKSLRALSHLDQLENLNLNGTMITDDACLTIKKFTKLHTLGLGNLSVRSLYDPGFDGSKLSELGGLNHLRVLDMQFNSALIRNNFRAIRVLKLDTLNVRCCRMDDSYVEIFMQIPTLRKLVLIANDISAVRIVDLQLTLPDIEIVYTVTIPIEYNFGQNN